MLNWPRLKNMMGVLLLALYFISVHIGMELRLAKYSPMLNEEVRVDISGGKVK